MVAADQFVGQRIRNAFPVIFRAQNRYSARSSVSDQSETKLTARTMALTWRYGRNGKIA
jgi:hypothetical protein